MSECYRILGCARVADAKPFWVQVTVSHRLRGVDLATVATTFETPDWQTAVDAQEQMQKEFPIAIYYIVRTR